MAGLNNSGKNALLEGLVSQAAYASLHTGDPGSTGANEVTGGIPAYARKGIAWGSPSDGAVATTQSITFDVPGSITIRFLGYWSASTGGTFLGSRPLDTNQTFASQGTFTVNSGNLTESIN